MITAHSQTFTPSGTLALPFASQSKSNFPEMFSHHVDNQALIANHTAYHLPTVTLKKIKNKIKNDGMSNYPQVSNMHEVSENRWFII